MDQTEEATTHQRSKLGLILSLAAIFIAVTGVFLLGLHQSSEKSDEIFAERQRQEIHQAISNGLDSMAQAQQAAAISDRLVTELGRPTPDWQWIDDNVGLWLQRLFKQDQVYILGSDDTVIYGNAAGLRISSPNDTAIDPGIQHLVDLVRGRESVPNDTHGRLPGQPLAPDNSLRTTSSAVHATDLGTFLNRPAAVSVMRIMPMSANVSRPQPGNEPLLVSVIFLDGLFLTELARNHLIDEAHFHYSGAPDPHDGEYSATIRSSTGAVLGHVMWRPELPGSQLWRSMLPLVAMTLVGLGGIIALLAYRMYRLISKEEQHFSTLQAAHMELKASEAHAHHLAFHDVLTGLPNRAFFNACLDQALVRARNGETLALLMLDLDHFKYVNDTWGHLAGDALIQEFARRLTGVTGPDDTVARLGGDEFAILTLNKTASEVAELAERVLAEARRPFEVLGNRAFVGLSIGVANAPKNGTERTALLRGADIALYRVKEEGRNSCRVFSEEMDETVRFRAAIEKDLREALANGGELEVYYQPQIDSLTNELTGVEALARWNHPTRGSVSPQLFIPIAEAVGLIHQLGDWILAEACRAALEWPHLSIAVNLSPVQFRARNFADKIARLVSEAGVDPKQIELEITEGVLVDDDERVREALQALRRAGFRIALDDFGTGYSSLSYLRKFEVDKIKIDRSFVQNIGEASDSAPIINAVVTLGHAMGLTVTAEGVETARQRDFLRAAGCNEFQGYLFSKPVTEEEIAQQIASTDSLSAA